VGRTAESALGGPRRSTAILAVSPRAGRPCYLCLHFSLQGTRSDLAVQSDGQGECIPRSRSGRL